MTQTSQTTPDQEFDKALSSEESKLALAELIEKNKQDKIVESVKIKVPSNLFDNLEEI